MVRPIPALRKNPAMTESLAGGAAAAPLSMRAAASLTSAAVGAARQLVIDLERGRRIDAAVLRGAMEAAFGASDATGAWNWKTAYDVCEAATVLFLRKFGPAIRTKAASTVAMLPMLTRLASLLPTHTRRSEASASGAASPLRSVAAGLGGTASNAGTGEGDSSRASDSAPAWVRRMKRTQTISHGASAATHAIRSGDHGGGGGSVDLSQEDR
ncbi:type IV secretory pathway TrbL component [Bradyrhizobium sp. S3.3.6]